MRRGLVLTILLSFLFKAEAQVKINEENFPDANFREFITSYYDSDGDGELSESNISQITRIESLSGKNIKSLEGISFFTNLQSLNCSNNQLTSLDVTGCTLLQSLNCSNNQLTSGVLCYNL